MGFEPAAEGGSGKSIFRVEAMLASPFPTKLSTLWGPQFIYRCRHGMESDYLYVGDRVARPAKRGQSPLWNGCALLTSRCRSVGILSLLAYKLFISRARN